MPDHSMDLTLSNWTHALYVNRYAMIRMNDWKRSSYTKSPGLFVLFELNDNGRRNTGMFNWSVCQLTNVLCGYVYFKSIDV